MGYTQAQLPLWEKNGHEFLWNQRGQQQDTGIAFIHRFHPAQQAFGFYQDLGNYGTPVLALVGLPVPAAGFRHGFESFKLFGFDPHSVKYYQTKRPYTKVQYTQGTGRLLRMNLLHTQNINPRWNVGIDFKRLGSKGFYVNQNTDWYSGRFFQSYRSKGGHYLIAAHLTITNGQVEENGGLADPTAFSQGSSLQRQSAQMRFVQSANLVKDRQIYMKQSWSPGKRNAEDTILPPKPRTFWLSHTLLYREEKFVDSLTKLDQTNFWNTYLDTNKTFDSIRFGTFENRLEANYFLKKANDTGGLGTYLTVGFLSEHVNAYLNGWTSRFTSNAIYGSASSKFGMGQRVDISGKYYLTGYNAGDHLLTAAYSYTDKRQIVYSADLLLQGYMPAYTLQHFYSNHFIWNNQLKRQFLNEFTLKIRVKNGDYFSFTRQEFNHAVILDKNWPPGQTTAITIFKLETYKKLESKHWFTSGRGLWQLGRGSSLAAPLPRWGLLLNACYKGRYLKSSLTYRIGLDLNYFSEFTGYGWHPILKQYYPQIKPSRIGGYPMLDVYIAGQIKTFAFFVKLEHAFANTHDLISPYTRLFGALPVDYNSTYGYPMQGMMLRLGFNWRFSD